MSSATFLLDMQTAVSKFKVDTDTMVRQSQTMAQRMEASFRNVGGAVGGTLSRITGLQTAMASLASLATVGGLALLVKNAVGAASAINDMSIRTGVGIERLQELQHAARLSGISSEELEVALQRLNRTIGEAAAGNRQAISFFEGLGISIRDSSGTLKSAGDAVDELADKMASTENPTERARIAFEAFGRGGGRMITMLAEGREGLDKMAAEARRLGLVMDANLVRQAEAAGDKLETLAQIIKVNLASSIGQFISSEQFSSWVQRTGEFIRSLVKGAKDLGLIWRTPTEDAERLRNRIAQLEADARRIQAGATIGDRISRFFGQDKTSLDLAAKLKVELETLLEGLEMKFQGAPKGRDQGLIVNEAEVKRLAAFNELVASLGKDLKDLDSTPLAKAIDDVLAKTFNDEPLAKTGREKSLITSLVTSIQNRTRAMKESAEEAKALADAEKEAADAAQRLNEADRSLAESITQEVATPLDVYQQRLRDLDRLLVQGKISQETYERALLKAGDALNAQTQPAAELISRMQDELTLLGMSTRERLKWAAALQVSGQATTEQRDKIRDLAGAIHDLAEFDATMKSITEETALMQARAQGEAAISVEGRTIARLLEIEIQLRARGVELTEAQRDALSGVVDAQERVRERIAITSQVQQRFNNLAESVGDAMIGAAIDGRLAWEDFLKSVIRQLLTVQNIALAVRAIMTFAGSFGGGAEGSGGTLGSPGPKAGGGPVSAREMYLVGEEGPELFVPRSYGTILSNRQTRGAFSRGGSIPFDWGESGASGPLVVVNVTPARPDDSVSQTRRKDAEGREVIDLVLTTNRSDGMSGGWDRIMSSRYGLKPTAGGR